VLLFSGLRINFPQPESVKIAYFHTWGDCFCGKVRKTVDFTPVLVHSGCKAGSEPTPNYFFTAGLQPGGCIQPVVGFEILDASIPVTEFPIDPGPVAGVMAGV
jgi:hypothetical protein